MEIPLILVGLPLRCADPRQVFVWDAFPRDGRDPAGAASSVDGPLARTRCSSASISQEREETR